jgi:hypothetical protein
VAEYDKEIVSLAQQVLGQPKPKSEPPAAKQTSSQTAGIKAPPQPSETRSEARKERADSPQARVSIGVGLGPLIGIQKGPL